MAARFRAATVVAVCTNAAGARDRTPSGQVGTTVVGAPSSTGTHTRSRRR
ncbi:hypothetical protein ACIBQ1_01385 [Nonomuraea sp. NPDC050153]